MAAADRAMYTAKALQAGRPVIVDATVEDSAA
jgi:hypothetical protein